MQAKVRDKEKEKNFSKAKHPGTYANRTPKFTKMSIPSSNPRPQLLTWLCAGSAVFGILWIIMLLTLIGNGLAGYLPSRLFPGLTIEYLHSGYIFISSILLLTVLALTGVGMMWKMKKTGFYLYAATKTLIYFLPVIVIGTTHLTFFALITTSIMITLYGINFTDSHRNLTK
jgi:hypothetical protein